MVDTISGFNVGSVDPIDSRIVLSKLEMKSISDNIMPEVYLAICKDDGKVYVYNKKSIPSESTGKFTLYYPECSCSGGGTGDIKEDINQLIEVYPLACIDDTDMALDVNYNSYSMIGTMINPERSFVFNCDNSDTVSFYLSQGNITRARIGIYRYRGLMEAGTNTLEKLAESDIFDASSNTANTLISVPVCTTGEENIMYFGKPYFICLFAQGIQNNRFYGRQCTGWNLNTKPAPGVIIKGNLTSNIPDTITNFDSFQSMVYFNIHN